MSELSINKTCVITPVYPDEYFIERGIFVENLVRDWKQQEMEVDVIAPKSISNIIRGGFNKKRNHQQIAGDQIIQPYFITVSNKNLGILDLELLSRRFFVNAVIKGLKKVDTPSFYYGKFLMRGGIAAIEAKKITGRPAFVDIGEYMLLQAMSRNEIEAAKKLIPEIDGIACVSEKLSSDIIRLGADPKKIFVHPNTVDLNRFYPMDKNVCRKKLNLPQDKFLIIFVGHFIERKGPHRIINALKSQTLKKLKAIFIGRGPQKPSGNNVLHRGPVLNRDLPYWLNAADVFVLPTLNEGHCNAINEAMACGLPIISSNIPEIQSQVPNETGILVNPRNTRELRDAIITLKNNQTLRKTMSNKAVEIQRERNSTARPTAVLEWIKNSLS